MLTRLRSAGRGAATAATALDLDHEDAMIVIGLVLLGAGLWLVSHAAALVTVGIVLLWVFLPPRPPFVERPIKARGEDR